MDLYPGDLLAGVFPLVFAVNAILAEGESKDATKRSLFERFLDAIAASLVEEEQSPSPKPVTRNSSDPISSLLRSGDDNDESSDEDDDNSSRGEHNNRRGSFRGKSPMATFRSKSNRRNSPSVQSQQSTAYARVLTQEPFFQRARIESVSNRHGFPPSKDPEGNQNRATILSTARASLAQGATGANALRLKNILENQPAVEGILTAGWLEKHVHALPSVILVVTTLSRHNEEAQKQHLLETMEQFKQNLAPKRNCHVHIVCIMEDPSISIFMTDAWMTLVRHHTGLTPDNISLLSAPKDLLQDVPTSVSLKELHESIRNASLSYYLQQARRAKRKHKMLGHERQPTLLPLAARYCFKIGVFYEFQLKYDKSLKYFALAHRHVQAYYQYLLDGSPLVETADLAQTTTPQSESNYGGNGEVGIEVSLADASDEEDGGVDDDHDPKDEDATPLRPSDKKRVLSAGDPPDDMTHQCRAVADWLNFKLLQAGFQSMALGEPDGLLAASSHWKRHSQVFLRDEDGNNPCWSFLSYVAHQRLVMTQLVERNPPTFGSEEILARCSPWRNYLSAAEAEICLACEIVKEAGAPSTENKLGGRSMRQKFVGGLDSDGLTPKLVEESNKNHKEIALQFVLRAIELFEQEVESNKSNNDDLEEEKRPYMPSGTRLYYIAGGILLGMERYQQAIPYLEKAARDCFKWEGIEVSIRKMLVACYEKYMPPYHGQDITNDARMLDVLFHAELEARAVQRLISRYADSRGTAELKWQGEYMGESSTSLPFSFSVTFPGCAHATAGDTVLASVALKSNLDYSVHVQSVTLSNASGQAVTVPASDLARAENADEGMKGCIVVPPNTAILFTTKVALPGDTNKVTSDSSQANSKAATSPRPRAAGITTGGGARFVSEDRFGRLERTHQTSKRLLGGKPLECNALRLFFSPIVIEESVTDSATNFIEAVVEQETARSMTIAKKTPFDEHNYVETVWSRPTYVPLFRGPRCLRVLDPMPRMTVTNLTEPLINGKALEGTVNRIVLKLQAGHGENCADMKCKVSCSSTLLSGDGKSIHLNSEKGDETIGEPASMRTPAIVVPDETSSIGERTTVFGYVLPLGWRLTGTGHSTDELTPKVLSLNAGESTYLCLELYRPPRALEPLDNPYDDDIQSPVSGASREGGLCQTDFDLFITYSQQRVNPSASAEQYSGALSDAVVLEYSGSVVWEPPLTAEFITDRRFEQGFPSGSRHPSNHLSASGTESPGVANVDGQSELALINGERTSARCVLKPNVAEDGLGIKIARIGFEEKDGSVDKGSIGCELHLASAAVAGAPGVIYEASDSDSSRTLVVGSKFGLTYSVEPKMLDQYMNGSISTRLGVVWVDWFPVLIPAQDKMVGTAGLSSGSTGRPLPPHGPLCMKEPATVKFRGPPCYVENAPFETVLESLPPSPRVAIPFEMTYRISNKTGMHQKLSVLMSDQSSEDGNRNSEGVLVSGLVKGDLLLGPFESQTLSYTALATKAGKTTMPGLSISCDRWKTWVVKDMLNTSRVVFVMP